MSKSERIPKKKPTPKGVWFAVIGMVALVFIVIPSFFIIGLEPEETAESLSRSGLATTSLPTAVQVPHCSEGWSRTIAVTRRLEWPRDWPTRHRMVVDGQIVIAGNGDFKTDAIQFCVTNQQVAGMDMPLIWK